MNITKEGKYRYACGGEAEILTVNRPLNERWPVLSMHKETGRIYDHTAAGEATYDPEHNLIPISEWDDFKDGEPVMVRDSVHSGWARRHFAGISQDGKPTAYQSGMTKWTSTAPAAPWPFCRRPTKEEMES